MNATIGTSAGTVSFQASVKFAWKKMLAVGIFGGLFFPIFDAFKYPEKRSWGRAGSVAIGTFVLGMLFFWIRFGRCGSSVLTLNDQSLTIENNKKREVLPWE